MLFETDTLVRLLPPVDADEYFVRFAQSLLLFCVAGRALVATPSMRRIFVKPFSDSAFFAFGCDRQGEPPLSRRSGPTQKPWRAAAAAVANLLCQHTPCKLLTPASIDDDVHHVLAASRAQERFGSNAPSIRAGAHGTEHLRLHA